ncbi:hypothetical protein DFH06DRAFT_1230702 [Mycena polygramma]|nr:hypothetical protein DFH06DRAFT_1230702 [Mycena polygramma]
MSLVPPCIPGDPDISGIGVRAAIYAQNLLSFIPAISALWDGEVAPYELEAVKDQSTTILITAFGILISAIVQATTLGLSNFHASIILSLSWMNNTNTFIYFLLYVQHRSQLGPQQIRSDVISWIRHIKKWLFGSVSWGESNWDDRKRMWPQRREEPDIPLAPENAEIEPQSLLAVIFRVKVKGIVAILGSLHLSMMAALGLWLWSNPRTFGTAASANACGIEFSTTVILGKAVPLASSGLRIWSILVYAAVLAPGLNLLIPMFIFLGIIISYRAFHAPRRPNKFDRRNPRAFDRHNARARMRNPNMRTGPSKPPPRNMVRRSLTALQAWYNPFLFPTVLAMLLLFAINITFLVDIELTLRRNRYLQSSSESVWTFGQTLAMLLLVLPLRDLRVFGAKRDVTAALQNAVRWHASTDILWDLVRRGADVNVQAEGTAYPTALSLAVSRRKDVEFARILLASGADPDIPDTAENTPLQTACSCESPDMVKLLLESGADPNVEGGEYGTALQAAAACGNAEVVRLLLEAGADVNVQGGRYGTALQAAESCGHAEVVELLRAHGAMST